MKKALIVANLAGFASFLISDIKILQKMGYEVFFAANTNSLPWEDTKETLLNLKVNITNIDFETKNPFSRINRKAYKQLNKLIKTNNFKLIHCHTPIVGFLTRIAARSCRKKGTKVIYTTHGFSFTEYSSRKEWLLYYNFERFSSRFCDAIITINKEDYLNAKKMHCKKIFYINGVGVDLNRFQNVKINIDEYKTKLNIPLDKIMILSVGELSERKNHRIIIKAIEKLYDKDRYIYVICGNGIDGGTGNKLKLMAHEKGVNLKMLGFRFDIPEIIKCSDIGAIPSIREGLGLAGIQSIAEGIPLVASNVQGIKDYVINDKTGYLCNPFDENEFADAIKKLSEKAKRKKMKYECENMARKFDISVSEKQRKKIYEEILTK